MREMLVRKGITNTDTNHNRLFSTPSNLSLGKASKENRFFLGKSPKLWVGGGQESKTCENVKIRVFFY